mgnify:CR=1 FL=1
MQTDSSVLLHGEPSSKLRLTLRLALSVKRVLNILSSNPLICDKSSLFIVSGMWLRSRDLTADTPRRDNS